METPPAEGPVRWQRQEARRGGTKGRMAEPGTRQHQTALQAAPDRLELLFGQMTDCREGESGGGTPARIRVSTARPGGSSSSTPRAPGTGQESSAPRAQHWGPPRSPRGRAGVRSPKGPALGGLPDPLPLPRSLQLCTEHLALDDVSAQDSPWRCLRPPGVQPRSLRTLDDCPPGPQKEPRGFPPHQVAIKRSAWTLPKPPRASPGPSTDSGTRPATDGRQPPALWLQGQ